MEDIYNKISSMYLYLYKVTNRLTGEYYVGSRKSNLDPLLDEYKGSMVTWKVDKNLLQKEILEEGFDSIESMRIAESNLISSCIKDPLNKNSHIPSIGFFNKGHSEETIEKLRISHTGLEQSEETIQKRVKKNRGQKRTEETKAKMRKPRSEETKAKMRKPKSEEHKKNIAKASSNISEETRLKRSLSMKAFREKNPLSEERKKQISETLKNKNKNAT